MPRLVTQLTILWVFLQICVKLLEGDIAREFNRIGLHEVFEGRFVDV